jgi:hypothetical protein
LTPYCFPQPNDDLHALQIDTSRGDLILIGDTGGIVTLRLQPGWRRLLRLGDFEPIRIRFLASAPSLSFQFAFRIYSNLPRDEIPETIAIVAKQ